jgi:flagellin-like hook-associated protein FlgL
MSIILGAATQQNLLSLQTINSDMNTTQGHLATGLKVSSAVDNAVLFFQAQSLTNRANDLDTRKSNMDQGVSTLTAATQGIQAAISILQQMQGVLQSAKTETTAQRKASQTQINTLAAQLNQLLGDTSYQGLNLVNSTAAKLSLQFSDSTKSVLNIKGFNLLISKLDTVTGKGASVYASNAVGGFKFTAAGAASIGVSIFDTAYNRLNGAIALAQADAQSLGANVSLLQTRITFTASYETTLSGGASKLTVADVNQESTNLVTLQTRQQLAIQSLSIATQSEQAVLRLFH